MTNRQFIVANIFKKFGILKKQKRLKDAAFEVQLLKEAEEILGRHVWTNVKELENYKVNYWEISKLLEQKDEHISKIVEIKEKIDATKQTQEAQFKGGSTPDHNIVEMYEKQKQILKKIKSEQEDITNIAANIKRSHDGAKAKLQAITDDTEVTAEKAKLEQLKNKFSDLKEKKTLSDQKLAKQTAILAKISDSLKSSKNSYKDSAADNYQIMGKANKALSAHRSKIGLLNSRIIKHYHDIGNNISKECYSNKDCKSAVKDKFDLCKIIKALRQSIEFNHTLAGR